MSIVTERMLESPETAFWMAAFHPNGLSPCYGEGYQQSDTGAKYKSTGQCRLLQHWHAHAFSPFYDSISNHPVWMGDGLTVRTPCAGNRKPNQNSVNKNCFPHTGEVLWARTSPGCWIQSPNSIFKAVMHLPFHSAVPNTLVCAPRPARGSKTAAVMFQASHKDNNQRQKLYFSSLFKCKESFPEASM